MSSRFRELGFAGALIALQATTPDALIAPTRVLRFCADPNNLPFSNSRGEGFENRLAELIARDRHAELRYTWWAQRRGFFRSTLDARQCDVVLGVPTSFERVLATAPYYRSSYVFVSHKDRHLGLRSFDDPRLRRLRIGVPIVGEDYANTPPAQALAGRGIVRNVVGYPVYGDYGTESPPARIVAAVADGEIDVAVVWGPLAGYFAPRQAVALELQPVAPQQGVASAPFVFDISVGVRRGEQELRDELDEVLRRRHAEVEEILGRYGVPTLPPSETRS